MSKPGRNPKDIDDFAIDLETLSTDQDAVILSIGVVNFDIESGRINDTFYRVIDLHTALKAGTINASTLSWWMRQSDPAKAAILEDKSAMPLSVALDELVTFMRIPTSDPRVWGNGATFDISILKHAFKHGAIGLQVPWDYWRERDMRTLMELADGEAIKRQIPPEGTPHNALDDAVTQAKRINAAWRYVRNAITHFAKPATVPNDDDL